jgi:hypothetical protein
VTIPFAATSCISNLVVRGSSATTAMAWATEGLDSCAQSPTGYHRSIVTTTSGRAMCYGFLCGPRQSDAKYFQAPSSIGGEEHET